uniref:Aerotaxis sensor receptor protein n=1 Tax=Klebsiella pneumoniae TaxID=573 RepID=A0A6G9HJX0_KLEPN|nr:Aerotaxis sensor receptor protein [Klebsiella pneumoniae]
MPPAAFEHMWSTLKSGRSWMGLVKNRCKNGDHYWVSAYVTPIAKNGSIVEYQSVRTKPEPEQVLAAEKLYAQLRSGVAKFRSGRQKEINQVANSPGIGSSSTRWPISYVRNQATLCEILAAIPRDYVIFLT